MDGEFMSIVATTLSNLTVKKTKKREEVKMSNVSKPGGLTGIGIGLTWNLRKNVDLIVETLVFYS